MKKSVILLLALACFSEKGFSQQGSLKPIGSPINTKEYREHAFSISGDGKTFVFAQDRPNGTQLFVCTRPDKTSAWSNPKPISSINDKLTAGKLVGSTSLTADGSQLYFSAELPGSLGETDIYYAVLTNEGGYGEPQNVGEPLNTALYEGYPSVSADGSKLFFVRDTYNKFKGVESCYSIWMATKGTDGSWANFEKLPETVNSDCERAPFILPDGRTLLFSSIRGGGKGSFDLYESEMQDDGSWTFPKDLDFINSPQAEEYAAISGDGETIYVERQGDIYSTSLPAPFRGTKNVPVQVTVIDALTKKPINATVTAARNSKSSMAFDAKDGISKLSLRVGTNYQVACVAPGYGAGQVKIDLENATGNDAVNNVVELMPTKTNYLFKVLGKDERQVSEARMKVIDMKTNQLLPFDAQNGTTLTFGNEYLISVNAKGYILYSMQFTADAKDVSEGFTKMVNLVASNNSIAVAASKPVEVAKPEAVREPDFTKPTETFHLKSDPTITYETKKIYTLNDVYFDKNSIIIKSDYYIDINRLIELMTLNPKINVQLSGYADSQGDPKYNQILSEKRAKACADYLMRAGIEGQRVLVKGFGESELVFDDNGIEDKNKSRRVRFIVY